MTPNTPEAPTGPALAALLLLLSPTILILAGVAVAVWVL